MNFKKYLLLILIVLVVTIFIFVINNKKKTDVIYGVSFNTEYAQYLGLDPNETFIKILDDLRFKYIRISAQWDLVEKTKGEYDFSDLDWMMSEAAKRQIKIILVIGQKTPRWPECHLPSWSTDLTPDAYRPYLLNYISAVVTRYKEHPALEIWQVENEPFLSFGVNCPEFTIQDLRGELDLVKKIDPSHPTLVTDSGELSMWRKTAGAADLFGSTLYRVIWNKNFGYFNYDWFLPGLAYRMRLWFNDRTSETALITELQAEPWIPNQTLTSTPITEQFKSMSLDRMKKNINFSTKVGVSRAYLWGAEWWYWLEKQGNDEVVNYIKTLKKE